MSFKLTPLLRWTAVVLTVGFMGQAAQAAPILPSFATAPAGWVTDRYEPASFSNVGTYQGRGNVLGIGINSTGDLANRAPAYQSTFYNTQGRQTLVTGGAGSVLSADLYINAGWGDSSNGYVRTDLWGVLTDGSAVSGYPIIGFTNYGGAARLRVWEDDASVWVDLANAISYDAWTSLAISFTGTSYEFYVNGSLAYTDSSTGGSTGFSAAILQAYNFADPALGTPTTVPYVAHWSDTQAAAVPEPASLALVALALLGLGATRRKV